MVLGLHRLVAPPPLVTLVTLVQSKSEPAGTETPSSTGGSGVVHTDEMMRRCVMHQPRRSRRGETHGATLHRGSTAWGNTAWGSTE